MTRMRTAPMIAARPADLTSALPTDRGAETRRWDEARDIDPRTSEGSRLGTCAATQTPPSCTTRAASH